MSWKKKIMVFATILAIIAAVVFTIAITRPVAAADATAKPTLAQFINTKILAPYHSVLTGQEFIYNRDHYGIPIIDQLVLMKIETNLGNTTGGAHPKMSVFVKYNNFGCVKYYKGRITPNPGTFVVWNAKWYRWSTPSAGMIGWAKFVSTWGKGSFLKNLKARNWLAVARTYNGKGPHAATYASWCRTLYAKYAKIFKDAGYTP